HRQVKPLHVRDSFAGKEVEHLPDRHRHALTVRHVDPRVGPLDNLGREEGCAPSYGQNSIQGGRREAGDSEQPNTAVEWADVTLAGPKAGEVRVRITAAGVCHSDLHVMRGEWDVAAPLVMGHEGSGVVTELGEGVTSLAVGDHVVLSWVPPCGECRYCRAGHEARCQKVATVVAPLGVLFDGTSRLSRDGEPLHH